MNFTFFSSLIFLTYFVFNFYVVFTIKLKVHSFFFFELETGAKTT